MLPVVRAQMIQQVYCHLASYVALETPGGELVPKIPANATKCESRGFYHPILARLLCPVKWLSDFDADPKG